MKATISILFLCFVNALSRSEDEYWKKREELIKEEQSYEVGGSIRLTDKEQKINEILMNMKLKELNESFENPGKFLPAQHFFRTRATIEEKPIYKFLRSMPKGALLHTHDTALVSWGFLYRQTFVDKLYLCNQTNKVARLKFFDVPSNDCNWKLLKTLRETDPNFEPWFKQQMTLVREDYDKEFGDINKVWFRFQNIFIFVNDLITYTPVFVQYFWQALKELHDDGIMYVEFRGTLPEVYDLNGHVYKPEEVIDLYKSVVSHFKRDNPNFLGARIIYAPLRKVDNETVNGYIETAEKILKMHPDFVAGFDLVGQEDLGRPLIHFVDKIQKLQGAKFYFHAGETNWNHASTDINMVDAILLGTNRLGHAFALTKHPKLMRIVKEKEIALEISPISNQVLLLVRDMRNHPASIYLAQGYPVVITNDDPTFWGAEGVSYDWYMMFLGMSSRHADLKMLKQLAMNSIKYSSLEGEKKEEAMKMWNTQWNNFIENYKL